MRNLSIEIQNLISKLAICLQSLNYKIVTAESCTGGMLSSSLTAHPGSSAYFERGFVTYSNAAKEDLLGVSKSTLNQSGAVSAATAAAMASGALARSQSNIAVAITGIAGPGGGSIDKPCGTVFFSWALHEKPNITKECCFDGGRDIVRQQAVCFAIKQSLIILRK